MKKTNTLLLASILGVFLAACAHLPQPDQLGEAKANLRSIAQQLATYYTKNRKYPAQETQADRFAALKMQDPSNASWRYQFFCNNQLGSCFVITHDKANASAGKHIALRTKVEKGSASSPILVQLVKENISDQGGLALSKDQRYKISKSVCQQLGGHEHVTLGCMLD